MDIEQEGKGCCVIPQLKKSTVSQGLYPDQILEPVAESVWSN